MIRVFKIYILNIIKQILNEIFLVSDQNVVYLFKLLRVISFTVTKILFNKLFEINESQIHF